MSAVSQSYPNYLGGLNEQPDELKKPGQLKEAINVIPDPVNGLTRRPGFALVPFKNRDGETVETDVDPKGTWFELELSNQINQDYIYYGCVNFDGKVNIFNQDGEVQTVRYTDESIEPHQSYTYDNGILQVYNENEDLRSDIATTTDGYLTYFKHNEEQPLKYCVSKDHIVFTNPQITPTLSKGKVPVGTEATKYYSFINFKVLDTANYNYTFKRFYADDQVENYRYIGSISIDEVSNIRDPGWRDDLSLPLQVQSPFRVNIPSDPGGEDAVVEVSFVGQIVQVKEKDEYENQARYTYTAKLISEGKGFKGQATYRVPLEVNSDKPTLSIAFRLGPDRNVVIQKNDNIVPNLPEDADITDILIELAAKFKATGIDKAIIVGNGLYLEDTAEFSVSTDEIAVADIMNSQKFEDEDAAPIARVNTTAELPLECYPGFKVQVKNSFDGKGDYFLEYVSESEVEPGVELTKSDGYWEEIAKPFQSVNPNNGTLPHVITVARESTKSEFAFIISPIQYKERTAGTSFDNPSMFVDETPITAINYYKNRLLMFTDQGTVLSTRSGKIDELFINTALEASIVDPLDVVGNSNQRVPIHGSSVVNNSIVLFGTSEQYSLTTDNSLLTTETVNVTKVANYTFDPLSNPVYVGTNLGFISGGSSRFYEMTNIYDRGPVDINERSQQIQSQFGMGFNMPVSSREQASVLVYKRYNTDTDNSNEMYLYRFRQENSQESSQTAWVKWKLNNPIAYVSMPRDHTFVFVNTDKGVQLYQMDSGDPEDYRPDPENLGNVPIYLDGYYYDEDGVLHGDPYDTVIKFPKIYPISGKKMDVTANLTIHRLKLSTAAIGAYDVLIQKKGYDDYGILYEQDPADEYRAGMNPLYKEHIETIPIYSRNDNLDVTISTNYNAPMILRSMTWEGDYNRPYYKSV